MGLLPVTMDLNCDLGEGEPPDRTRALIETVTSVNIACGGHAGDLSSMERCVRLAMDRGARIGAHPGVAGAFGRGEVRIEPGALALLILHQASALQRVARALGARMQHIKLHGSLYHAADADPRLAAAYVETVRRWFPGVRIVGRAGGRVVRVARARGVPVWEEGFLDRAYRPDGSLVPRSGEGALISDPAIIRERIADLRAGRGLVAVDGRRLPLKPVTLCVHGDSPGALRIARLAARGLGRKSVASR